jgi:hypothetical protein
MTWQTLALDRGIVGLLGSERAVVSELKEVSRLLSASEALVIIVPAPGIGAGAKDTCAGDEWWFRCPTVLAAEGDICDAALGLVAASDVTVMAHDAQLVNTGTAEGAPVHRLCDSLPQSEVMRMALLGPLAPIGASRAAALGCVKEAVGSRTVRRRALSIARTLAGVDE